MKVFVTGASGFVGSAVVRELLASGHQVTGLVRSDAAAQTLAATGATVYHGDLTDLDSLRKGAEAADGVIHTAFLHDYSNFMASIELDRQATLAMLEVLAGSNRPLILTNGMAGLASGRPATEEDTNTFWRGATEEAAMELVERGVRVMVVRLGASVHDKGDYGLIPGLINIARQKGVSAYPGDGSNRWAAVHRLDAARLYRIALENGLAGKRYHAIGEEGILMREIAETIGQRLNLPVQSLSASEAEQHFSWLGGFVGMDLAASSVLTQQQLDWHPTQPGLLADMEQHYFGAQ